MEKKEVKEVKAGEEAIVKIGNKSWLAPYILPLPNPNIYCECDHFFTYREFVYTSGSIEREKFSVICPEVVEEVLNYHGELGISDRFRYRLRNFSEGLAFGGYGLIAHLQKAWDRKFIRPRSFMGKDREKDKQCQWSFTTRVLRL